MDVRIFEAHYADAIKYTKTICKHKKIVSHPEEFVNDAFLVFFDSGKEFDYTQFKKLIFDAVMKERGREAAQTSFTGYSIKKGIRQFYCISCCDCLPENAFRIVTYSHGYSRISSNCKQCENKNRLKWFRNNKERWAKYMRDWRSKKFGEKPPRQAQEIQVLWRKANHKYIEKQREILSDVYVRSLLKKDQRTPENIERKRQELLERRKKAA